MTRVVFSAVMVLSTTLSVSAQEVVLREILEGHTDEVKAVAFSRNGDILASAGNDGTCRLWEITTGKCTAVLTEDLSFPSMTFDADGQLVIFGTGPTKRYVIMRWDTAHNRMTTVPIHVDENATDVSFDFSPDRKTVALGIILRLDTVLGLWDVGSGRQICTLDSHGPVCDSIAFRPDNKVVASGWRDNTIKLWNVTTRKNTTTLRGHTDGVCAVAFSPEGTILASGGGERESVIRLWDVASRKTISILKGHHDDVQLLVFSPNGKTLASRSGGEDGTIKLWDVATGKNTATVDRILGGFAPLAFSPDGKSLATGHTRTIKIWHIQYGVDPREPYNRQVGH